MAIVTRANQSNAFVLTRLDVDFTDAGNELSVESGTWTLVRGTRAYVPPRRSGRLAVVAQDGAGDLTWRADGFFSQG